MKQQGLTVDSLGDVQVLEKAVFTDDASDLKDCDLILFTVKSYDTQSAINQIKPHLNQETVILTPQNSIVNDRVLAQEFGQERVIPGFAKIGVGMPQPAYVRHTGLGIINFGEYDSASSDRVKKIKSLFNQAGVQANIVENIQTARWQKYIWNCTFNIIAAIIEQPLDIILDQPETYDLCIRTIKEIEQVAIKEGINFEEVDVVAEALALAKKLGHFKPSTLEDVEKDKPIELDAFTGTVIKLAKKHDLEVPVNQTLYALLAGKTA